MCTYDINKSVCACANIMGACMHMCMCICMCTRVHMVCVGGCVEVARSPGAASNYSIVPASAENV